jgi:high-affinity iron transporter
VLILPTFVIGLREGLEAALIVGIIAAFLGRRGRGDLLRLVWIGVGVAVAMCVAIGVALEVVSADLPQRQQEGLETVVGIIAVAMVTYMVVWMRRHARALKGDLEGAAGSALASGRGSALIGMAFLAVLREGFETAVFLLAAFNASDSPMASGAGALLGILLACALGYGMYRGGVRINLARFFRITGALLVLVAAGLVVSAARTAHEAGWLEIGQGATVDLTWLVRPGTVTSSLLTGILGLQARPVVIEVIVWLLYLVPVGLYVLWPAGRAVPRRVLAVGGASLAIACGVAALLLLVLAPAPPAGAPADQRLATAATSSGALRGQPMDAGPMEAFRTGAGWRLSIGPGTSALATPTGHETHDGRSAEVVSARGTASVPAGLPATLSLAQVLASNGGRLPLGVDPRTAPDRVHVTYSSHATLTAWIDEDTGRVIDGVRRDETLATARFHLGPFVLDAPVLVRSWAASSTARAAALSAARADGVAASTRSGMRRAGVASAIAAGLALLVSVIAAGAGRLWPAENPVADPGSAAPPSHG